MKKYIRICNCCGNTFETDMMVSYCKSCSARIRIDSLFYKVLDIYKMNGLILDTEYRKLRYGKDI